MQHTFLCITTKCKLYIVLSVLLLVRVASYHDRAQQLTDS